MENYMTKFHMFICPNLKGVVSTHRKSVCIYMCVCVCVCVMHM